MNFLYIGTGTCMDYWINGQLSRLPTHMCSVIQYYSYSVCGCDVSEPNPLLMALSEKLLASKTSPVPRGVGRLDPKENFVPAYLLDIVIAYDEPRRNASVHDVFNETIQGEVCLN